MLRATSLRRRNALMSSRDTYTVPLPRWPPKAFKYEPAHGYFLRLAERNGAQSARVFADGVGLNGRNFDIAELLRFCQKFPIAGMEELIAATPSIEGSFIRVNGQTFRKATDWSARRPRVCDACLGEVRYYRNWWDLSIIGRCPIHDRPLVGGDTSSSLAWWYPAIGVTSEGHDLAISPVMHSECRLGTWDAYVLGRMGVILSPSAPLLDKCELFEAIAAVEFLGKAGLFGFRANTPGRLTDNDRLQALNVGFSAFRAGENGLIKLIEAYVQTNPRWPDRHDGQTSLETFFGWLWQGARNALPSIAMTSVEAAMRAVADRHCIGSARGMLKGRGPNALEDGKIALEPLARKLGVPRKRLRVFVEILGLCRNGTGRGVFHSFGPEEIALIKATLGDLLSFNQALQMTGFSRREFKKFCKANAISAFASAGTAHARFRKSEIAAHLELRHRAEEDGTPLATKDCLRSQCSIRGFRPRANPIRPGLRRRDAAVALGVEPIVIKALIDAGYLGLTTRSYLARATVDETSVKNFKLKYAPAHLYAGILQCRPNSAMAVLEKHGLAKLPNIKTKEASFVDRIAARVALGLTNDPDEVVHGSLGHFWKEFVSYVRSKCGSTRMFNQREHSAVRLYSGDRRFSVVFKIDKSLRSISYELTCDPRKSFRRYERASQYLPEISERLAQSVIKKLDDGTLIISEGRECNFSHDDCWREIFEWIEHRMLFFRSIFAPKAAKYRIGADDSVPEDANDKIGQQSAYL